MSNTLYPNLETPNLHKCIDQVFGPPLATEAEADAARQELAYLKQCVKDCKEQMERSSKALEEVSKQRTILVNKLCDIRDTLKVAMKDQTDISCWVRRSDAIKEVLRKNFSLDIDA